MANWGEAGKGALGYGMTGAKIGSIVPGLGTLAGLGIGAGVGFFKGLFGKKKYNPEEHAKAARDGGYFTVPPEGYPGHPEWKPGTRQWIPAGSPGPGQSGGASSALGGGASAINYDAIRERSIAPTRGIYQNAMRNLNRQQTISGGLNPGYGSQLLALSRGMSNDLSDAATKAEATVAETRLGEIGQQQQYDLGLRQDANQKKQLPSGLDKGISTTANILGLIGKGVDVAKGFTA